MTRVTVHEYAASLAPRYNGATKLVPALAGYLAVPLDIIPDFIPVLGQLDDLLIVAAGLWLLLRLIPLAVVEGHVLALEER